MLKEFPEEKKQILITLKKASSHISKIEEMVNEDKYCIEIIQQMKAVHGLIHSAMDKTLELHLTSCFKEGMKSGTEIRRKRLIGEVIQVTKINNQ
ncbi:hypothetical protein A2X44_02505 [candidate division CPR3 bacterium GWF2_35_18]|nr:MAG: hypothetical protein A2X44_02505 [candidate division CPR3 bacterium GWF2_35_18]OGB65446.1 MAG: hypothetical protein A2250_00720 [candidate division CPR3 bacterium RIFOXYA2_FULL_35_13]OGB78904.1 MAG: hypothetical protein A2296_04240 [candidate division CPR3 bacterium RIFOXYB2_FULL_35_8]